MAVANLTSRSSCFPVCAVNLPTTWLPRRLPRFESKMSRHGLRRRSGKPCSRYAEENLALVSLGNRKQKQPNFLLIQDKTFHNLGWRWRGPACSPYTRPPTPSTPRHLASRSGDVPGLDFAGRGAMRAGSAADGLRTASWVATGRAL